MDVEIRPAGSGVCRVTGFGVPGACPRPFCLPRRACPGGPAQPRGRSLLHLEAPRQFRATETEASRSDSDPLALPHRFEEGG
jgi:hypothetical protein